MLPLFRNYVRANENRIRTSVSTADDVYTTSQLAALANLSGDWRQKLKQSLVSQSIYGDIDFASLNMNNTIPVIGMNKDESIVLKDGGIFQGKIVVSQIDILENARIEDKIDGDLNAIMAKMYYTLDDIVYGNDATYTNKGLYGIVSNPNVEHTATALAATYGNSTAEQIIGDMQTFIRNYFDGINSDATQRPINIGALNVEVKIPTTIMQVLRQKKYESTDFKANYKTVLEFLQEWTPREGYNVAFIEDTGMEIISPIIKSAGYKVMEIGVFSKSYMTLEVPFAPHRLGTGTDAGFYSMENGDSCAYTMKALGTQINRTKMFVTRDV